ncbi:MAG: bacterial Ig-like domain-containing protein, partial [Bacteroidales bacterium]|nr:bacterial Ig-like domain-containing protein [Bacteroidales bacterium]
MANKPLNFITNFMLGDVVNQGTLNSVPNTDLDYLCFTAEENGSSIGYTFPEYGRCPNVEYSVNNKDNWQILNPKEEIPLQEGEFVYFRGDNPNGFSDYTISPQFVMSGKISASGNIMSLIDVTTESKTIPSEYCFFRLFENCDALTSAPELPATQLAEGCYDNMFYGCISLTYAPILPSTQLTWSCYNNMFMNCTSLNSVNVDFKDWGEFSNYTSNWLSNVSTTGTLYCPDELEEIYDDSHIPLGWTVVANNIQSISVTTLPKTEYLQGQDLDLTNGIVTINYKDNSTKTIDLSKCEVIGFDANKVEKQTLTVKYKGIVTSFDVNLNNIENDLDYLCFTAEEANSSVGYSNYGGNNPNVEISFDKTTWISLAPGETITLENVGSKVYFRGDNHEGFSFSNKIKSNFNMTGKISASGNIMSLVDIYCESKTIPCNYCFYFLFSNCSALTTAPDLTATILCDYCYYGMFSGCKNLKFIKVDFSEWRNNATYYWLSNVANTGIIYSPKELPIDYNYYSIPSNWSVITGEIDKIEITTLPKNEYVKGQYLQLEGGIVTITYKDGSTQEISLESCVVLGYDREKKGTQSIEVKIFDVSTEFEVTVKDIDYDNIDFLCFLAEENGSSIGYQLFQWRHVPNIDYSINSKNDWKVLNPTENIQLQKGDFIYFRGDNPNGITEATTSIQFTMSGSISASGNIMSLIDVTNETKTIPSEYCFADLFYNCSALTSAPILPSTQLTWSCYNNMFMNCTSLNSVNVDFKDWGEFSNYTSNWLSNVSTTGTLYCPDELEEIYDDSHIPLGWTVVANNIQSISVTTLPKTEYLQGQDLDLTNGIVTINYKDNSTKTIDLSKCEVIGFDANKVEKQTLTVKYKGIVTSFDVNLNNIENDLDYLCFTAEEANSSVGYSNYGGNNPNVEISFDKTTWISLAPGETITLENVGSKVYFRGNNPTGFSHGEYSSFYMNGKISASGNIMSLVDIYCESLKIPCDYCFYSLFSGCSSLTTAPELPATQLAYYCYSNMFSSCSSLTTAPELPAT